eukprot:3627722-Rhodomonas_salina.2
MLKVLTANPGSPQLAQLRTHIPLNPGPAVFDSFPRPTHLACLCSSNHRQTTNSHSAVNAGAPQAGVEASFRFGMGAWISLLSSDDSKVTVASARNVRGSSQVEPAISQLFGESLY